MKCCDYSNVLNLFSPNDWCYFCDVVSIQRWQPILLFFPYTVYYRLILFCYHLNPLRNTAVGTNIPKSTKPPSPLSSSSQMAHMTHVWAVICITISLRLVSGFSDRFSYKMFILLILRYDSLENMVNF